ncbi:cation-transporting P-type ATPase [Actinospica sp. MGRD01-02]|uniref:Cation-transporting P-type ATPase n=1 Tax=Actinospica acidithermotolerans TaxID=2828514 RepID=A0A941IG04_9ACTN|nr:cation-transporting P-type ATPase [Actinospica acidithermotolerans]MBR7825599.1 cation-transporting P-type ATPase [Actinospica acidithermotolerans]
MSAIDQTTQAASARHAAGLSSPEAARRLALNGPNALPPRRRVRLWQRVLMQLRDPLVAVLLVAAALTIGTGDWTDAGVILLVIVVNTSVGVAQEVKADQSIAALDALTAPHARVVRDGLQQEIASADVVRGDLLALGEGEIVPADAVLVQAAALLVDESALTGESVPVDKGADTGQGADPAVSKLSAGTVVVRGRGLATVTATGADSAMGRIAALMGSGPTLTPLQRRLVGVGRALAIAAVALCAVVLALGLARGQAVELMIVTAISLVVAAVPESLPAVVTLALALGARRMAARNALVRRLPAVETLGSVTVLATDKTGTITEGAMLARALWTPGRGAARIEGTGYEPSGRILRAGPPREAAPGADTDASADAAAATATATATATNADTYADAVALLSAAALCNDAALRAPTDRNPAWTAVGDPIEAALLAAAGKLGLDSADLAAAYPRVAESPFDSERRRMTTVHRRPGGLRVVCKGAPEALLKSGVLAESPSVIAEASRRAEDFARDGLRVLAVAQAEFSGGIPRDAAGLEHDLRLLGLVAVLDPPRASAAATIAACRAAGIAPILITGDHPATACAIARDVGILRSGEDGVIDCRRLGGLSADEVRAARVFARALPAQKLAVIEAHRAAGDVVAMTGDGVNDAPALRRADIGVAMGDRGTEVARQAADLVLADDELATVVHAAEEGRRVYANIRRFLLYALAGGSAEIIVMLLGPLLGLPLFLLPSQILWINLLTHGLPGVALGSEPVDPGTMRRPPRPPAESVLGAGLWQRILCVGTVISAVTLGVAVWGHADGRPWQSMAFFALGATQLAVGLASRARPGTRANPLLPAAIAGALALQLAGLYLAPLRHLLGTQPLTGLELLVVSVLSALGYPALKIVQRIGAGRRHADHHAT